MNKLNVIKKMNVIVLIISIMLIFFANPLYAVGDAFSDADDFLEKGDSIGSAIDESQLIETSNFMYKLLLSVGIVVMFIIGTILGIQFMLASAEDKAKVKEALVPYIVGCAVIFGAFTIWETAVIIGQGGSGPHSSVVGDKDVHVARVLIKTYTGINKPQEVEVDQKYYGKTGLEKILGEFFNETVVKMDDGEQHKTYELKNEYIERLQKSEILIYYYDWYDSGRYERYYTLTGMQFANFPKRYEQLLQSVEF